MLRLTRLRQLHHHEARSQMKMIFCVEYSLLHGLQTRPKKRGKMDLRVRVIDLSSSSFLLNQLQGPFATMTPAAELITIIPTLRAKEGLPSEKLLHS